MLFKVTCSAFKLLLLEYSMGIEKWPWHI